MPELLRFCLPALLVGFITRLALSVQFPYGYFQADSPDFLLTADQLFFHHQFVLHAKKAFLTPILFTLPFLTKIPVLIVVPACQHLFGLVLTVLTGALVRLWFVRWKWFIVPITVLTTLNPGLLWYEHALLAEFHFLFCITMLALAGTLFVRQPSWLRLMGLLVALLFTAGSRPEGKLFVVFGLLTVGIVHFGNWRTFSRTMAVTLPTCMLIWYSSTNSQAGLLLYATVLPLAPDSPKTAPDFALSINPLRDEARAQGATWRVRLNHVQKLVSPLAKDYLKQHQLPYGNSDVGAFCSTLAVEAMLNRPWLLPAIAVHKLQLACDAPTSGGFSDYWVKHKQYEAFTRKDYVLGLSPGLTGERLRTEADVVRFVDRHYPPLRPDWFDALQQAWSGITLHPSIQSNSQQNKDVPGLPCLFLFAAGGMVAAFFTKAWRFHVPWSITFSGVWFVVLLTGVVNPRYRFAYEPFCLIYAFLLFDTVLTWIAAFVNRGLSAASRDPVRADTFGIKLP